jgi:hypothetical protein
VAQGEGLEFKLQYCRQREKERERERESQKFQVTRGRSWRKEDLGLVLRKIWRSRL